LHFKKKLEIRSGPFENSDSQAQNPSRKRSSAGQITALLQGFPPRISVGYFRSHEQCGRRNNRDDPGKYDVGIRGLTHADADDLQGIAKIDPY
jgi:hypothetical protein